MQVVCCVLQHVNSHDVQSEQDSTTEQTVSLFSVSEPQPQTATSPDLVMSCDDETVLSSVMDEHNGEATEALSQADDELLETDKTAEPLTVSNNIVVEAANTDDQLELCRDDEIRVTSKRVAVLEISPYPSVSRDDGKPAKQRRKAEKSAVLTSTPNKKLLEEKKNEKKAGRKPRRRMLKNTNKKLFQSETEDNFYCIYCAELYVEPPTEDWIQCQKCQKWSHISCAPIERNATHFICDYC